MKTCSQILLALSLAIGITLSAGSAVASKQAVIKLAYKSQNSLFNPYGQNVSLSGGTPTVNETVIVATVSTGAATPTVMIPAGILAISGTKMFSGSPYIPTYMSFGSTMIFNAAATLIKSPPGGAVSGGSTLSITPATTKCFASVGPAMPGAPAFPGSCFPKPGTLKRSPGLKKFGGVARILGNKDTLTFSRPGSPSGIDTGMFQQFQDQSPALAVSTPNVYGVTALGTQYNTLLQTARASFVTHQLPPFSTGMATHQGSNYGGMDVLSGSHNLNVTNLTGMISLVRPAMGHTFQRRGSLFSGNGFNFGSIDVLEIAFLGEVPEPGSIAMLAFGTLGLAGLYVRRRL
jgi:hypothetical protein